MTRRNLQHLLRLAPRRWIWPLTALLALSGLTTPLAAANLADTIASLKPSVVGIGTRQHTRRPANRFLGTGFVVGDGRHVLTNAHTIKLDLDSDHREFLAVFVGQGSKVRVREAEQVAKDLRHDLSLLRISGQPLPALRLGDSDRVREGDPIAFTGFPIAPVRGLYPATHRGIVAAILPVALPVFSQHQLTPQRRRQLADPFPVFQLDAVAYPGNSGSPLFDPGSGEVVGIINAVFAKSTRDEVVEKPSGISYAIPIRRALRLIEKAGLEP
jgi:serine protease Do